MSEKLYNELNYIVKRNQLFKSVESYLEQENFIKVEPDYFESYDNFVLTNKLIEPSKMIKVIDPSNKVLLLRPDITSNLIKQVAPFWNGELSLKLFYNTNYFRQTKTQIVQTRQIGFEILGEASKESDAEVIKIVCEIFDELDDSYRIDIGNQGGLLSLINTLPLSDDKKALLRTAIASKNQDEINKILEMVDTPEKKFIMDILNFRWNVTDFVSLQPVIPFIKDIYAPIKEILLKVPSKFYDKILIDLALLTEYDYYDNVVFQGYLPTTSKPVISGGRYDKLTKLYGSSFPAVGASFDVKPLLKENDNE